MENQDNVPQAKTPTGVKHLCLPFESEAHDAQCLADLRQYRTWLQQMFAQHPALFPRDFGAGFHWHAQYRLKKQALDLRRLKLKATGQVFTVRPSFLLPYGAGRTDEVWQPLQLHAEGTSLETLVELYGHDLHYWERLWLALGRPSLVGTTVKDTTQLPTAPVADEKHTWLNGEEVLATSIASQGCFLGAAIARGEAAAELAKAYGEGKTEAQDWQPDAAPESVCTDGFRATRLAWMSLFPTVRLILCFLHGVLKIRERCQGEWRREALKRAWHCYRAETRAQLAQRLRRLDEWAEEHLSGTARGDGAKAGGQPRPLYNRVRNAVGLPHDERGGSADEPSGSLALRDVLSARGGAESPLACACASVVLELSYVQSAHAPRRPAPYFALCRLEWFCFSRQLVA